MRAGGLACHDQRRRTAFLDLREASHVRTAVLRPVKTFFCDHYEVPLPPKHRFPMHKYRMLRNALRARSVVREGEFCPAPLATAEDILRVHDADYFEAFLGGTLPASAIRELGFPYSQALVRRCLASVGGTIAASDAALDDGVAGVLAGGTHHAQRDRPAGYCVFHDAAVSSMRLLAQGRVRRVLLFDVDVHQGDGTAAIFRDEERVFTCSLHGAKNYPRIKPASDLDVPLPDACDDARYLEALRGALDACFARFSPDLVIYQGGVDVLASDRLGRLSLSPEGCAARDRVAFEAFRARGLPFVLTLGGGYADPIERSVDAHVATWRAASEA